ncbi:MAG: cytochrome c3 family protein, partial [Bacteriovoracaceae bacterium]
MMMLLRFFTLLLLFVASSLAFSQTNDECLACHSDNSLTMEKNGKTLSLYVNDKHLGASPHKKFSCTTCHTGFDPNNLPHKEEIRPVQCATCHQKEVQRHNFHKTVLGKGSDQSSMCKQCHGKHDVVSPKIDGSKFNRKNIVSACGTCHAEEKEKFLKSAHGVALASGLPNSPNCLQCHSVLMPTNGARSDTAAVKLAQEKMCISCHGRKESTQDVASEFVHAYEQSVHAKALKKGNGKAANCVSCHSSHDMQKGSHAESRVNKNNIPATCSQCHADVVKTYKTSIHGKAFAAGNTASPVCTDCHGEHKLLGIKDPNSPVSKLHVSEEVCAPCHSSVKMSEKFGLPTGRAKTFNDSYH